MEILIVFPLLAVLVAACWCLWGLFLGPVFGQEMLTLYYVRGDGHELENRVRSFGWFRDGKTGGRLPLVAIFLAAAVALTVSLQITQVGSYIAVNMIFYVCNSMYLPLQQALAIRQWKGDHGAISGVFSSVRAAGMVSGSLSAGLMYEVAPRLTMGVCAGVFFVTAVLVLFNIRQYKEGRK